MFLLNGMVQTETAWQCALPETSKTSGEWRYLAVHEYYFYDNNEIQILSQAIFLYSVYLLDLEEYARYSF